MDGTLFNNAGIWETAGFLAILVVAWVMVGSVGHGFANTVDRLALWLHRWAEQTNTRHERERKRIRERWVRQVEEDGQGDGEPLDSIYSLGQ